MSQSVVGAQIVGLPDGDAISTGTLAISASGTRLVYSFKPWEAKTLSKVKVFASAVTGTLGASDLKLELYSYSQGTMLSSANPSSLLQTSTTVTATPTGASWVEFTGFTQALTAGTQYALVLSNANGTPASNFPTYRWTTNGNVHLLGSSATGWNKRHSTDAFGTNSVSLAAAIGGVRLEFSDGTFAGMPFSDSSVTGTEGVFAAREMGVKFTTPADAKLRVIGIGTRITFTGTPGNTLRFRLYNGTSLIDTTASAINWTTGNTVNSFFSSPIVLSSNNTYRAMMGENTNADTSANRFNMYQYTVENDANSKALLPFGGWVKTVFDGTSTWTDTDTSAPIMWLILDTSDPFDTTGGGTGGTFKRVALGGGLVG